MKKIIQILTLFFLITGVSSLATAQETARFLCVKGDQSSEVKGKCPKHSLDLVHANDPQLKALVAAEIEKDLSKNNVPGDRFLCAKGDFSDVKEGKCPKHSEVLLNINDPALKLKVQSEVDGVEGVKSQSKQVCFQNEPV